MMNVSVSNTLLLLAGVLLATIVWLAVLTIVVYRVAGARNKVVAALKGGGDIVEVIAKALDNIEDISAKERTLDNRTRKHRELLGLTVRQIGLVRYDAFSEVGGRLSFSAALLNEGGDGLVITSINGRSDSRVYAKPIVDGSSTFTLSEEELEAISQARKGVKV